MDAIPDTCVSIYRSIFDHSRSLVSKLTGWPASPILLLGKHPNIITDCIIPYLKVEDVLSLRKVITNLSLSLQLIPTYRPTKLSTSSPTSPSFGNVSWNASTLLLSNSALHSNLTILPTTVKSNPSSCALLLWKMPGAPAAQNLRRRMY